MRDTAMSDQKRKSSQIGGRGARVPSGCWLEFKFMITQNQIDTAITDAKSGFLTALEEIAIDELTACFQGGKLSAGSLLFLLSVLQPEKPELRRLVGDCYVTDSGSEIGIARSEQGLLSPLLGDHSLLVLSNAKVTDAGLKTGGNDDA